jgi:uncharacterized membrane protein YkvA (DUF1232 family)
MRSFLIKTWKDWAHRLKVETYTLYLAARHPGTPWYAKVLAGLVAAYAFSPIDLIPDFIPVLGYLDDLIIVPLGIYLTIRLVPAPVVQACRAQAQDAMAAGKPVSRVAAMVIVAIWVLLIAAGAYFLLKAML